MRHSKYIVLSLLILAACTKPDTKPADSGKNNSSFIVDSAKGSASPSIRDPHSAWRVADEVQLRFQACFKDSVSRADLLNGAFSVADPATGVELGSVKPIPNTNCISWTEELGFNPFAKRSIWIRIQRNITGKGVNAGTREVHFAVNPWALHRHETDAAVIHLADPTQRTGFPVANVSDTQRALSGELFGNADLYIRKIDTKILRQSDIHLKRDGQDDLMGSNLFLELSTSPMIRYENAIGEPKSEKLQSGELDILMQYMATEAGPNQDQKMIIVNNSPRATGRIIDGEIKFEARVSQTARVNQGNLQLVLKLVPRAISRYLYLNEFNGIFKISTGTQIHSGSATVMNSCLEDNSSCDYTKELKSAANFADLAKLGYAYRNEPYVFEPLKLRFNSVVQGKFGQEETATHRTVAYTASTCIRERHTEARITDMPFIVKYVNGTEGSAEEAAGTEKHTDASGCLNWTGVVSHHYYQPEDFIKKTVVIQKASGFKQVLHFYLNPWDDKFTFGWDERELSSEYLEASKNRKKIPSRFSLADFKYHTVRFRYDIDQFLDLEVKKTILIELSPRVLRYSGILKARGNSEPLRDGIYLLKLGIQKNYLDPSDRGGYLIKNVRDKKGRLRSKMEKVGNTEIAAKDFITSRTSLVRVVDGSIVYPMELTMKDLRLMRVRSNFLIQIEPVDERRIQTHQALRSRMVHDLELVDKARQLNEINRKKLASAATDADSEKVEAELKELIKARRAKIDRVLEKLRVKLERHESLINSDFELDEKSTEHLKRVLGVNDFTGTKLSKQEETDLQTFIEKTSGLDQRTFVGPVIFLSNTYSDSVRATDNLDEACSNPVVLEANGIKPKEADELDWEEVKIILNAEKNLEGIRQNNAYNTNSYFGALTKLCFKSVDSLIDEQKTIDETNRQRRAVTATKSNYISTFNLDYISLTGKPLERLDPDCEGPANSCLAPSAQNTVSTEAALDWTNRNWNRVNSNFLYGSERQSWTAADLQQILMSNAPHFSDHTEESYAALCGMMAARAGERAEKVGYHREVKNGLIRYLEKLCISHSGLMIEPKLHVSKTGQDYKFKGGLQLNINVGDDVSIGRSSTWSTSFDFADVIGLAGNLMGPTGKMVVSSAVKPFGLSYSTNLSASDRTSVSKSTYLVSQIAGFLVDLREYETCVVIRFNRATMQSLHTHLFGLMGPDSKDEKKFALAFGRGLLACEGQYRTKPLSVEETYYYFTQHFTEGDMLDQADLYNHPWLLSLRGYRDFTTFIKNVSALEVLNFTNFAKGIVGLQTRAIDWPLVQMWDSYRETLPSFPGFYSVLNSGENRTKFPLDHRMVPLEDKDLDINDEVKHGAPEK